MAMYGCEIPTGKGVEHQKRRDDIFSIVARYCLSKEDMEAYMEYTEYPRSVVNVVHKFAKCHDLGQANAYCQEILSHLFP